MHNADCGFRKCQRCASTPESFIGSRPCVTYFEPRVHAQGVHLEAVRFLRIV